MRATIVTEAPSFAERIAIERPTPNQNNNKTTKQQQFNFFLKKTFKLRATMVTEAPSFAERIAVERPIPDEPPVIRTCFP